MIEIVNNQRMLTDGARVCVTIKVCLLLSVICQDCIKWNGTDNGGNRSFTNNSKCRVFTISFEGSCSWWIWCWCHDIHQCGYLLHQRVCCTKHFGPNLLLCRLVSPGLYLLVEWFYLVRRKCLILLLGILHIFISSSIAALTFLLSSSFVVRWLYPWNIQFRRRDLLTLINECFFTKRHIHRNQSWG